LTPLTQPRTHLKGGRMRELRHRGGLAHDDRSVISTRRTTPLVSATASRRPASRRTRLRRSSRDVMRNGPRHRCGNGGGRWSDGSMVTSQVITSTSSFHCCAFLTACRTSPRWRAAAGPPTHTRPSTDSTALAADKRPQVSSPGATVAAVGMGGRLPTA
jgi:hypothetical protein